MDLITDQILKQYQGSTPTQQPENIQQQPLAPPEATFAFRCSSIRQTSTMYNVQIDASPKETVYYSLDYQRLDVDSPAVTLHTIERRYSQFVWLQGMLRKEFLGVIVPSIPLKEINYDIEQRKKGLPDFLNKVIQHPRLSNSVYTKRFINEKNSEAFQTYVDANPLDQSGYIQTIVETGQKAFKYVRSFIGSDGGIVIQPRAMSEEDVVYDQMENLMRQEQEAMRFILSNVQIIVNNMKAKKDALKSSEDCFSMECVTMIVTDVSAQDIRLLQTIQSQYNRCYSICHEQVQLRLENYQRDFDCALFVLATFREKKDQKHQHQQLLNHPAYIDQRTEIRQKIDTITNDIATIEANLKEDFEFFKREAKSNILAILTQFDTLIEEFHSDVAKVAQ